MNLRFITSDCNCKDINNLKWKDRIYYPIYVSVEERALEHYKYELERRTLWFGIHINGAHINNIFIDNQSLRRIG